MFALKIEDVINNDDGYASEHMEYSLITVPIDEAILRPIAPPDNESKLALSAQAHALVPAERMCGNEMKQKFKM